MDTEHAWSRIQQAFRRLIDFSPRRPNTPPAKPVTDDTDLIEYLKDRHVRIRERLAYIDVHLVVRTRTTADGEDAE